MVVRSPMVHHLLFCLFIVWIGKLRILGDSPLSIIVVVRLTVFLRVVYPPDVFP